MSAIPGRPVTHKYLKKMGTDQSDISGLMLCPALVCSKVSILTSDASWRALGPGHKATKHVEAKSTSAYPSPKPHHSYIGLCGIASARGGDGRPEQKDIFFLSLPVVDIALAPEFGEARKGTTHPSRRLTPKERPCLSPTPHLSVATYWNTQTPFFHRLPMQPPRLCLQEAVRLGRENTSTW